MNNQEIIKSQERGCAVNHLILLRGLPGAGKSTLAAILGFITIEADHWFRLFNGGEFDGASLGKAHAWCQERTRSLLEFGHSVIVSNTSTTEEEVEVYSRIAAECGARFTSLIVENRHGGESVHNVPAATVDRMRERFSIKL